MLNPEPEDDKGEISDDNDLDEGDTVENPNITLDVVEEEDKKRKEMEGTPPEKSIAQRVKSDTLQDVE